MNVTYSTGTGSDMISESWVKRFAHFELSWDRSGFSSYLCIRCPDGGHCEAVKTVPLCPDINLDIDYEGNLVGIEIVGSEPSWIHFARVIDRMSQAVDWTKLGED